MHSVKLFYIRHIPTGNIIPYPKSHGRGGSFVEPCVPDCSTDEGQPRLFRTEFSARNYLSQWLRGHCNSYSKVGISLIIGNKVYGEGITWEAQPHRRKEDMEICSITVAL